MRWVQNTPPNITPRNGGTVSMRAVLPPGPTGPTGATGPGSAAWAPTTAVGTGDIRQAPDGSYIRSNSSRTTRASFDATEEGFWTSLLADPTTVDGKALTASFVQRVEPASYTYNGDGTVATETVGGLTTTYTYNADGSVHTATRNGVTLTYSYNADGTVSGVA